MSDTQTKLWEICLFISYAWADRWFSNPLLHYEDFHEKQQKRDEINNAEAFSAVNVQ